MASDQRSAAASRSDWSAEPSGPSALEQVTQRRPVTPDARFQALPAPVGEPPYRRALADVLGPDAMRAIAADGALRFHAVGDTGGDVDPRPQRRVAAAMARELSEELPVRFFYHLGDVVYPHGEEVNYRSQFFGAYGEYGAPIFAVPGNHDAEPGADALRLEPFVKAFCSPTPTPPLHDAAAHPRPASAQPNVFWTLVHEWVWIVGLWANVPEGGQFADDQLDWLVGELRDAPADASVILAVHQPVFSADVTHGSNTALADALDECFARAGRDADAVFCGHAHCYQRFARQGARTVPYVVAGAGGFHELHALGYGVGELPAAFPGLDGVTLEAYQDTAHGFMTVTVTPAGADVVYTAVTESSVTHDDSFRIRG
ncbi:MAG: metallophosphoesterase [Solirubrobacteraceae bacterium]